MTCSCSCIQPRIPALRPSTQHLLSSSCPEAVQLTNNLRRRDCTEAHTGDQWRPHRLTGRAADEGVGLELAEGVAKAVHTTRPEDGEAAARGGNALRCACVGSAGLDRVGQLEPSHALPRVAQDVGR